MNASIGEQVVFRCLFIGQYLNFQFEWRVNEIYIDHYSNLTSDELGEETRIEGQGHLTLNWTFTVSAAVAKLWNNVNVSCQALPLNNSREMKHTSEPVLLKIQGNSIKKEPCFVYM